MADLETRHESPDQHSGNVSEKSPVSTESDAERVADTDNQSALQKAPDGGVRAWLVVCGACFIALTTLGYANSFGVLLEYYMSHQLQDKTADEIAWIGSTAAFLQFAAGGFAGPLFDRYGAWIIRPAAVMFVFVMMLSSLCTQYWHFMLVQGVLLGFVMAMLMIPAMSAVLQFFDKKRGTALGISIAGSSIGGVVMPIVISRMLNRSSLGFGWTFRILGFIMLPLLAFSCVAITSYLPPKRTSFFLARAFTETRYQLLLASAFFMFIGMWTPLFYLPAYAVSTGTMSPSKASNLLAILNGASTFGRVIPGILADKFGRLNIYGCGGLATGIVLFCWQRVTTSAGLIVYAVFVGFTTGTISSGLTVALSDCTTDTQNIGTYLGMGLSVSSVAILIGPPINGALVEHYGGYTELSLLSGALCLVGGTLALLTKAATPHGLLGRV